MFVDIHSHLTYEGFEKDVKEVIERSNCVAIIDQGTSVEYNRKVIELSKKFSQIKVALGLYPEEIVKMNEKDIENELKFIEKFKPFAIGEVGIDRNYENTEKQIKWLKEFIKLSLKLNIPIIIHSRKLEKEAIDALEEMNAKKVVMHCFSGSMKLVDRAEKLGYYFSIPPVINHLHHFQELVKQVSITRLLTETDSPFLSNVKGERNEPRNVQFTIDKIAELKGMEKKEVENSVYMNFQRLFL